MTGLYLRDGDRTIGPFPEDSLRQRCAAGSLSPATMSWREGEARWQSLGRRWGRRVTRLRAAATGWAITLLGLGFAFWIPNGLFEQLPSMLQSRMGYTALTGMALLVTLAGSVVYWRGARRYNRGRPTLGVMACGSLASIGSIVAIGLATVNSGVLEERLHHANAAVAYDAARRELHIDGPLGPRLADDVARALSEHAAIERVVIDSPGGLIVDARRAGEELQERGLAVRVHGSCASACVLIWAGATTREMTIGSSIGLHQSRIDSSLPDEWIEAAKQTADVASSKVLRAAGFSDAVLARQRSTSPDAMYWMNPVEASESGVALRIVGDDGAPIGASEARLRLALGAGQDDPRQRFADALARRRPELVEAMAAPLYGAWIRHAIADEDRLLAALGADARQWALARAPDVAVLAWAGRLHAGLAAAVRANDAERCVAIIGPQGLRGAADRRAGRELIDATAALLDAVPGDAGDALEPIAPVFQAEREAMLRTLQPPPEDARDLAGNAGRALRWCGVLRDWFGVARQAPPRVAAQVIRLGEGVHAARPAAPP